MKPWQTVVLVIACSVLVGVLSNLDSVKRATRPPASPPEPPQCYVAPDGWGYVQLRSSGTDRVILATNGLDAALAAAQKLGCTVVLDPP